MNDLFGEPLISGKQIIISIPSFVAGRIISMQPDPDKRPGGFQLHMRETFKRLHRETNQIDVDYNYIGRTFVYSGYEGGGGWEDICKAILRAVHDRRNDELDA